MRRIALAAGAIGALALVGCDVSVTSNDAGTREALNGIADTARDVANEAEEVAGHAGNGIANVAGEVGEEAGELGDRIQNGVGNSAD